MRPALHFAHANSYPAGCYRKLLSRLDDAFDVHAIERIGHDPRYPVSDNWPHLVDEMERAIAAVGRPVIGVGHSLGGALTVMVALRRPDLFRGLVILDSPLLSPWRSRGLWAAKRLGRIEAITPAGVTLRRRDAFDSTDAMQAYFAAKRPFSRFDPDVLADYARLGSEPSDGGVRLAFRPEIEYRVYCTLPHVWSRLARPLAMPAVYVVGQQTDVIKPADLRFIRRRLGMQVEPAPGSHLFPLEYPLATADLVARLAAGW